MSTSSGSHRRGGLGRGLGALIPGGPADSTTPTPQELPINRIEPNPFQPRSTIDPAKLQTLADSIRQHGIIQPLVVREAEPGRFYLIAGERRWRAAQLAGIATVPVVLKDASPRAQLELALVENVVRADLSPLEEAAAYRQLVEEFGLTQGEVAERVGRSRVSVTNTMRLLLSPDKVQSALNAGHITEGHARALLGLPSAADQVAMLDLVIARSWTVRQTEEAVRRWLLESREAPAPQPAPIDHETSHLEDRFRSALGARVSLKRDASGGAGSLTIHFSSDDDLQGIYDRIVGDDPW